MHEDGLADTADGFWGGWTAERRLEIMKDSVIGSYGVIALILGLGLRWLALSAILAQGASAFEVVIAVAVLSRAPLPLLMTALPKARPGGLSASVGAPGNGPSVASLGLGLGLATLMVGPMIWGAFLVAVAMVGGLAVVARRKIGGQTGDVLGAAQQLAEVALLVVLSTQQL